MSGMLFKCGTRSAERGTTSFRFAPLTRKIFECKMQSAECKITSFHFVPLTRKKDLDKKAEDKRCTLLKQGQGKTR